MTEPWGKSRDLTEAQRAKVKAANKIVRAVLRTLKLFHGHGVPWIVENPDTLSCGTNPFFRDTVRDPAVIVVQSDQCRFRRAWRKITRFICGNIAADDLGRLSKMCQGSCGCCPHNGGAKHFQLQGQSPSGVLCTTIAAAYPAGMASALAHALTAADFDQRRKDVKC